MPLTPEVPVGDAVARWMWFQPRRRRRLLHRPPRMLVRNAWPDRGTTVVVDSAERAPTSN